MCEGLGQATGVDKNTKKQNTKMSELILNFRSVFVIVVSTNPEGEQNYGEQT